MDFVISCLKFLVMGFGSGQVLSFIGLVLVLMFGRKCNLPDTAKDGNLYDTERSEDGECDVAALRRMVKAQRREVERERSAAAWAAQDALAMILALQTEKSRAEMASVQFRRVAEERQRYSEGVMEDLRRTVAEQEDEIRGLRGQLGLATDRRLSERF